MPAQSDDVNYIIAEFRTRLETFGNRLTEAIAKFEAHMKNCDQRFDLLNKLNEERHIENRGMLRWILGFVFSVLVALLGALLTAVFSHMKFG